MEELWPGWSVIVGAGAIFIARLVRLRGRVAEQGNGASYEQDNGATGAGQPCPGRWAHTTTLLGTQ